MSHHPAERFSSELLRPPGIVTRADCLHLFDLLPKAQLRDHVDQAGDKFLCGSFRRGGIHGVLSATREFPLSTAALVAFVKSINPDFSFSSIALHRNVPTSCHKDTNNFTDHNLVCALSSFADGQVWVQDSGGTALRSHAGVQVAGTLHEIALPANYAIIPARRCLHSTEPWSGDRLVLIAYAGGDHNVMSAADKTFLSELGFPLPPDSGTDCPPVQWLPQVPEVIVSALDKAKARIAGRPLRDLVFLEFFCGSGGLCAEVRKKGLVGSRGVDHQACHGVKCPVVSLDLATPGGAQIALEMISRPDVVLCHFAPPCGTAITPGTLRSHAAPDGVPGLQGAAVVRVTIANQIYEVISSLIQKCHELGILWCLENPNRSLVWRTSYIASALCIPHMQTRLHHCMFGSQRRKHTLLCHNIPFVQALQVTCDGQHDHLPWGRLPDGGPAMKTEVSYPPLLCRCLAHACVNQLLHLGAIAPAVTLHNASVPAARAAQVAASRQPNKRLPPLVSEFAAIVTLRGPESLIPSSSVLEAAWPVDASCISHPPTSVLPAGTKRLSSFPDRGSQKGLEATGVSQQGLETKGACMVKFGIPWLPSDFVSQAIKCKHPKLLASALPKPLKECIEMCVSQSAADLAKERTATLRQWMLRAKELKDECNEPLVSPHCKDILASKSMRLLGEMIEASGYGDVTLPSDIGKGFNLLGPIPDSSGVMPKKATFASLSVSEVREVANDNQRSVWQATKDSIRTAEDLEIAREVYRLTLAELEAKWVEGPFGLADLPKDAILTRRFGVVQSSWDAVKGAIKKIRPIDDLTESLANLTSSGNETIAPHGVDCIIAGLVHRSRQGRVRGLKESLKARTIDLKKAYKQLPLSEAALHDSYICILNPDTLQPEAFRTRVLPFGARPSVSGFCRASHCLWFLGVRLFRLHWSCFFDDFFLVSCDRETAHLDLIQKGFFEIMGWSTSVEKDDGFRPIARALGVEINLADSAAGLFKVSNTEARQKELSAIISGMLEKGSALSKDFEILRGRLIFAENQIFGRMACRHMQRISRACRFKGMVEIRDELAASLLYMRDRVVLGNPRSTSSAPRQTFHLFTDASLENGESGLGAILYNSQGLIVNWFAEVAHEDIVSALNVDDKKGFIYEMEAYAAIHGIVRLCYKLRGVDLIVFCDNEATVAALIKSSSEAPIVRGLLMRLNEFEESHDINCWFERVASASNPADAPSRSVDVNLPNFCRIRWHPAFDASDLD